MDMTSIWIAFAPELVLVGAGLLGVLLGAVLRKSFDGVSYRYGALSMLLRQLWRLCTLMAAHLLTG